jgi:nicotinamidase-related amidase
MTVDGVEKPALLIIDMVKDNFDESANLPITPQARQILGPINRLIRQFRSHAWPVIFATDAYHRRDFIFKGRMKPHSLAGTPGGEVVAELDRRETDLWLPKPRFSAFFQTGLADHLRENEVTLCAVAGVATHFCVLTTTLDALCHDFKAVLLEDCCAAPSPEIHARTLALYRRNPLYPLLQVMSAADMLAILTQNRESSG